MSLSGFSATPSGRLAFHDFVVSRSRDELDPVLSGGGAAARRAEIRRNLGAPVESTSPTLSSTDSSLSQDPVVRPGTPLRTRWDGDLRDLLESVEQHTGIPVEAIQS
ncbi:MAG: hypothetical protein ABIE42_10330, partial [Candidatus Eisenbacteria bacterium]